MGGSVTIGPAEPSLARPTGERRQVTVVFYDIVDSTALLSAVDPEDFGLAQRTVHTTAAQVTRHFGGHLERIVGDGGCAYFGYPTAAEDAAEDAVSAALEFIERCKNLDRGAKRDERLRIRVGIATGTVVVSNIHQAGLPGSEELIGLAPNLAARLQSVAEPDSVIVSDSTYALTRSAFEFAPVGEVQLKGFQEPQRLWRPIARRNINQRFRAQRRPDAPLMSRESELELCRGRWRDAQTGRGSTIFVSGVAGIGKSRLVSELVREAGELHCDRRVFQCQPRGHARPFHALTDRILRDVRDYSGTQSPDPAAIRAYLSRTAPGARPESAHVMSFLIEAEPDLDATHQELMGLPSEAFRTAAVEAALDIVAAWSRARPQLIVFEDMQWADGLTRSLLARAVDATPALAMLLVATTREAVVPHWGPATPVTTLNLSRLSPAAVPQLVQAIWDPFTPPKGMAAFIDERSDGVPLFIEELTQLLRERFSDRPSHRADWEQVLRSGGVVVTLKDLLSARIAGLGDARRIAQVASVIGRDFSHRLLQNLLGAEFTGRLDDALAVLVERDIVHRQEAGREEDQSWPDEPLSFRFRHVLLQEAAYDSLLKSEQRELHGRIATIVAESSDWKIPDDLMAWHCEQAGRLTEAARYAIRAAERCAVRSAMRESEQLLANAETHMSEFEPGSERDDLLLRLVATRGPVAAALFGKGSQEARALYEQGVALCQEAQEDDRAQWFPLYWGWWFTAPDFATQQARSEILVRDLEKVADPEVRLQSLHCAWAVNFHSGRHAYCLHCVSEGLALYDADRARLSRVRYGGHDAKVCALGERALSLWFVGDDAGAQEAIDATMRWADEIDHLGSRLHALNYAAELRRCQNDHARVLEISDMMARLAEEHSLPGIDAKARLYGGWARAMTHSLEEGTSEFESGLALQREIGTEEAWSIYLDMQSEILTRAGFRHEALVVLDEAIASSTGTGQVFWLPELYRRRAKLRRAMGGSPDEILSDLDHALDLAERQGASALAARARHDKDAFVIAREADGAR